MSARALKIISIITLSLLALHVVLNILAYYNTWMSLSAPYIPKHVPEIMSYPYGVHAVFMGTAFIISLIFHSKGRYKIALWICLAAVVLEFFLPV